MYARPYAIFISLVPRKDSFIGVGPIGVGRGVK